MGLILLFISVVLVFISIGIDNVYQALKDISNQLEINRSKGSD